MLQIQDDPFSPERVELHPLAVVQAPGALHPLRELQVQRIVLQIEHMHIEFVALARRYAPVVGRDVAAAGPVDAFAVPGEPFAHLHGFTGPASLP